MDALGDVARVNPLHPTYATCIVWIPHSEEEQDAMFGEARRMLGLRLGYEFHATQLTKQHRTNNLPLRFFTFLESHSFKFEAWILEMDKQHTTVPDEFTGKLLMYELTARMFMRMPRERVEGMTLVYDDTASGKKAPKIAQELRSHSNHVLHSRQLNYNISSVKIRPAHKLVGLQLADYVVAAVVRGWHECDDVLKAWPIDHWRI